jgi:hypothetical protein
MTDGEMIAWLFGLAWLLGRRGPRAPSVARWMALLVPGCVAHQIPLEFALKWIEIESGGNPCAIGDPSQRGPDGEPRELGIAQLHNPDDLRAVGVASSELRAYCVPGTGVLARPLTLPEMSTQAVAAVGLIANCMAAADLDLAAVGARWTGRDYWTLVKLRHGLPGLARSGLLAVTRLLGRAPESWREFRAALGQVTLDRETMRYRGRFAAILDNAERCASVLPQGE